MPNAIPLLSDDPGRIGQYRLAGRLVRHHRLGKPLPGAPTAGTAFLARTSENEPVTVTLLDPVPVTDSATRDRFLAEARAARRVAPFCAARILNAGFFADFPYIVCEYVPGPSLREAVEDDGPRGGAALHAIAIGAATGLAAIHQAGLVHGDFGPDHLVLGREGPRVLHAGISPPYGEATPTRDMLAWARTVLFAAPDQRRPGTLQPREVMALPESVGQVIADCLEPMPAARPTARTVVTRLLGHEDPSAGVLAAGSRMAAGIPSAPVAGSPAPPTAPPTAAGGEPVPAPIGPASPPAHRHPFPGGGPPPGAAGGAGATAAEPAEDRYFRNPNEAVGTAPAGRTTPVPPTRPAAPRRTRPVRTVRRRMDRRAGLLWTGVGAGVCALAASAAIVFVQQSGSGGPAAAPSHVHNDRQRSAPTSSAPAPPGSATQAIPPLFNGSWSGTVHQHSALGLSFPVQISLTGGGLGGTVNYPSLGCSGPLTPLSVSNSRLVLQQGVSSGQQTCGQGTISLSKQGDGSLSYSFSPQASGGPSTTGTLSHR